MDHANHYTRDEILSQTYAWAEALQVASAQTASVQELNLAEYDEVTFIGCGSTYYLALSAAVLMQAASGVTCRGLPSSEILLSPDSSLPTRGKTALCAISRSGNTTETVQAVLAYRARRQGEVIVITNHAGSQLAQMADIALVIPQGFEKSVAQTRSFASMYVAASALPALAGKQPASLQAMHALLPAGERLLERYNALAKQTGADHAIRQVFFLGSGPRYGLACEASLKLKEMSLTVSEPFHFMEFRHGPISMVDSATLVIGLCSDTAGAQEQAVLQDVQRLGGRTLSLGEQGTDIAFDSGVPELLRGVLYLPPLQLMALYRAESFGLNPDKPRNLVAVVELPM